MNETRRSLCSRALGGVADVVADVAEDEESIGSLKDFIVEDDTVVEQEIKESRKKVKALDLLDGIESEATKLKMVRKRPLPFPPEPFRFIFIRITQWSIYRADQNEGRRNLWLRFLDRLGLGFDS